MLYQYPNITGFIHDQLGWDDRWHERRRHVSPRKRNSVTCQASAMLDEASLTIERYFPRIRQRKDQTFLVLLWSTVRLQGHGLRSGPILFQTTSQTGCSTAAHFKMEDPGAAGDMPKQVYPRRNGHANHSFLGVVVSHIYEDFLFRVEWASYPLWMLDSVTSRRFQLCEVRWEPALVRVPWHGPSIKQVNTSILWYLKVLLIRETYK